MESWAAQFRLAGSTKLGDDYEKRASEIRAASVEAASLPV